MLLTVGFLCWFLSGHHATGFSLSIIPKNKEAKLSTSENGLTNPMLGNDGNRSGTYIPGVQCFHNAANENMPWWMVDMEQNYLIYGATVWNRLESNVCSQRFTQISLGVTANVSVWTSFNDNLFNLCMYYTGVPTISDNPISFTCGIPILGRFLAVYKNIIGFDRFFHFCEIDIISLSKQKPIIAINIEPSFSSTSTSLIPSNPARKMSETECLIQCSLLPNCLFALIRAVSMDCWLFGSVKINSSFSGVYSSSGTRFLAVG